MMMSLLNNLPLWKVHTKEGMLGTTSANAGEKNSEAREGTEKEASVIDAPEKSPQLVDITKEQAFWDKAVPS